jgi:hypothetical protein
MTQKIGKSPHELRRVRTADLSQRAGAGTATAKHYRDMM